MKVMRVAANRAVAPCSGRSIEKHCVGADSELAERTVQIMNGERA
ncbi:hypothetical protein NRB20_18370 [Nocardia sp. RB20]|uniref:Uncharacterized protein n=1 Tax=Nocardia macrotermitis TaxID=2585198 RepID=A0A7K0CZ80_9NOCA|nr:hypothetical protein [Nocardia macrotermitis]